jgi:WD40 repeat protein
VFRLPGPSAEWRPIDAPVTALALSADDALAVVGGEGGEVALLSVPGGGAVRVPDAHRDAVRGAAVAPGGWWVTGSADGTVKFWAAGGAPLLTIRTGGPVRKLVLSEDGRCLAVLVEGERAVRRWRLDWLRAGLDALGLDWDPP